MFRLRLLVVLFFLGFSPLIGFAQSCPLNLKLSYPNGEKGCLDDLQLSKVIDKSWGREIGEVVKFAGYYSVAYAPNCSYLKIATASNGNPAGGNNAKATSESVALSQCPKDCDCSILIQNGNVLIPKEKVSLIGQDGLEIHAKQSSFDAEKFMFEFNKSKNQSDWKLRVNTAVNSLLRQWIDGEPSQYLAEIPPPEFPPALQLTQEKWESNKEFEERIAAFRFRRQREIESIQADYKLRVNKRNSEIQRLNQVRLEKEKQLPFKKKELLSLALGQLNLKIESKNVSFDQDKGFLFIELAIENDPVEKYVFKNAPLQLRRDILTTTGTLNLKPEFFVSESGQYGIKVINVEVGGGKVSGTSVLFDVNKQQVLLSEKIDLPIPNSPLLPQQTLTLVDRNQIEQISYRQENESLRKQLEAQRKVQEIALAEEMQKVSVETAKLRAQAEAAKSRQRELESQLATTGSKKPINYGKALNAHALIIGNSSYGGSSKLPNPINDARAMSGVLRGLGFTVTESLDADRSRLVSALSQFSKTAASADITLLFYAGHGVQISGTNYMLPIDLNLNDLSQVPLQGVSLNSVVEQYLPGKTKLVFLDACRDNPLMQTASRSVSRGLAPINVSEGTLISYSTKDGQVAQDGDGKNSPFTTALIQHLGDPDDIAVVLRKVREDVLKNTRGRQQPWEYGSLTGGALVLSAIK
jgi:hypothetical protein